MEHDGLVRDGTREVFLRGLHGKVRFRVQLYRQRQTDLKSSYLDLTDQFREGYLSSRLEEEFVTYYAGRISYEEVERLVVRTTGAKLLSDQKIHQLQFGKKAAAVSRMQQAKITRLLESKQMPEVRRAVDLYAVQTREVVLMEDAIGVKHQKANRERRGPVGQQPPAGEAPPPPKREKGKKKRVMTDGAMLEKRDGGYEYLCGGIDERGEALYDMVEAVRGAVVEHYGPPNNTAEVEAAPLAVVAITDGAKNIRSHLDQVFGGPIRVILDCHHLTK